MKVLWLCNVIIPQVCSCLGIEQGNSGGWMTQLAEMLDHTDEIELGICAPLRQERHLTEISWGHNSLFWGFQNMEWNPCKYDESLEGVFDSIIKKFQPDIVHIFGTEFPHTLAMVRAFGNPNKTVIHIQGLVSVIAKHYEAYLPDRVVRRKTFRDVVRQDGIVEQKRKFEERGKFEVEALKSVNHVMGRTDWDRACCKLINPDVTYHYVQEMMREEFYDGKWRYENCEPYSVFMSQGNYPIKGLHLALESIMLLKEKYPNVKLYVAGTNTVECVGCQQKLRRTYYSKYLNQLIKKWKLEENIIFLGQLSAEQMKERFLLSNVFISPSSIENSPNSIGEAMLLGTPIVASDVGGVSSLIEHKKNGFLYQADATYMLAYYITQLFDYNEKAMQLSKTSVQRARIIYQPQEITKQLLDVYNDMSNVDG